MKQWAREGDRIIKAIEAVTKLKFFNAPLTVYMTTDHSLSDPLTLKIAQSTNDNIDNLTHELIHVLLTQNYNRNAKFVSKWELYLSYFNPQPMLVKSHVIVHAVHYLVSKKLRFPKRRHQRILSYSQREEYRRAWQIARKMGYKNVVAMLST